MSTITVTQQTRHNLMNRWLKNIHGCMLKRKCNGEYRDQYLVGAHVLMDKHERLAELASKPISENVNEYKKLIILCYRCHNSLRRGKSPEDQEWMEKVKREINGEHKGKAYVCGIPEHIIQTLADYHTNPTFRRLYTSGEYDNVIDNLTQIAQEQKLKVPPYIIKTKRKE